MVMDELGDGDGYSGDGLGDGNGNGGGFSDDDGNGNGFGDDTLDGVESLLMEDQSIPNDMFEPLYSDAVVTICVCAECEHILNMEESCHEKNGYMVQVPVEKALKTIVESELYQKQ